MLWDNVSPKPNAAMCKSLLADSSLWAANRSSFSLPYWCRDVSSDMLIYLPFPKGSESHPGHKKKKREREGNASLTLFLESFLWNRRDASEQHSEYCCGELMYTLQRKRIKQIKTDKTWLLPSQPSKMLLSSRNTENFSDNFWDLIRSVDFW